MTTSRVALLDTSLGTLNVGDEIIVNSILSEFPELSECPRLPTHQWMTASQLRMAASAKVLIFTGTNVLATDMWRRRQWRKGPLTTASMWRKVVLLGVGWAAYEQNAPDAGTRTFLRSIVRQDIAVSARDSYTFDKLTAARLNVLNTGCPTMWSLPTGLPARAGEDEVVCTVTDYRPDVEADSEMVRVLARHFKRILVWPQGSRDEAYLAGLRLPVSATVIPAGLDSLNEALSGRAYVGTRLHAGIRALQLGRPTLVVGVDNRAAEIARDTGLPYLSRDGVVSNLEAAIDEMETSVQLTMPWAVISEYKARLRAVLSA